MAAVAAGAKVSKKLALVFGAGPGIGIATARALAGRGVRVGIIARTQAKLDKLVTESDAGVQANLVAMSCDVTDPAAVNGIFDRFLEDGARLDFVLYNAGSYIPKDLLDITPADMRTAFDVGALAGFTVGQRAAKEMLARGEAAGLDSSSHKGSIFFTGATASLRGGAKFLGLAAPKFALRATAQSMARRLQPEGIHVAHLIVDGQVDLPGRYEGRDKATLIAPDAIASTYMALHDQPPSCWTHELDVRPSKEKF